MNSPQSTRTLPSIKAILHLRSFLSVAVVGGNTTICRSRVYLLTWWYQLHFPLLVGFSLFFEHLRRSDGVEGWDKGAVQHDQVDRVRVSRIYHLGITNSFFLFLKILRSPVFICWGGRMDREIRSQITNSIHFLHRREWTENRANSNGSSVLESSRRWKKYSSDETFLRWRSELEIILEVVCKRCFEIMWRPQILHDYILSSGVSPTSTNHRKTTLP